MSQSEVCYFVDGIKQGVRADGRSCDAMRPLNVELSVIPTANGSCRVTSRACDIYVAVKSEIGRPLQDRPNEGIINVSVEFGCSVLPRLQDFTGRQAAIEADALSDVLAGHISAMCISTLDKKQFCIQSGKACWVLSIDVLVERIDGPLLDPISIGIRGALMDLELPIVAPIEDTEGDRDAIPRIQLTESLWRLDLLQSSSICVSVGIYADGSISMVDLDRVEESIAKLKENGMITVSVNHDGDCCGLHKFGVGSIEPSLIVDIVQGASALGKDIVSMLVKLATATRQS